MKKKNKFKNILLLSICISFSCALYLNGQLDGQSLGFDTLGSTFANLNPNQDLHFPEVEVLKVVVEKFINVITMASV
jgi:hypothetical protein